MCYKTDPATLRTSRSQASSASLSVAPVATTAARRLPLATSLPGAGLSAQCTKSFEASRTPDTSIVSPTAAFCGAPLHAKLAGASIFTTHAEPESTDTRAGVSEPASSAMKRSSTSLRRRAMALMVSASPGPTLFGVGELQIRRLCITDQKTCVLLLHQRRRRVGELQIRRHEDMCPPPPSEDMCPPPPSTEEACWGVADQNALLQCQKTHGVRACQKTRSRPSVPEDTSFCASQEGSALMEEEDTCLLMEEEDTCLHVF